MGNQDDVDVIVETGERLPASLLNDEGLSAEMMVNPIFDGVKVIEGNIKNKEQ